MSAWPYPRAHLWMCSSKLVQLQTARIELARAEQEGLFLERDFIENPNPASAAAYTANRKLAASARRLIVWLRKPVARPAAQGAEVAA
jgi:hypothetical protein